MIRHLVRLLWSRKRWNALVVLEILGSFLVLLVVATVGVLMLDNFRRPLGYSYQNVWNVEIGMSRASDDEWSPEDVAAFASVLREVAAMSEVEAGAGAHSSPYDNNVRNGVWGVNGRDIHIEINEVTDEFARVLGVDLVAGRWFEPADEALSYRPVVLNRALARDFFGDEAAVGKRLPLRDESRVVGVVSDFRKGGELAIPGNYMFERTRLGNPKDRPPANLLVKVRPGVGTSFEPELARRLSRLVPGWTFEVKPLARMRESAFRVRLVALAIGGIIATFLVVMVALGLTGVLWQAVTRRRGEIGLRRALGASTADIQRQVLLEVLLLATAAILVGSALAAQIPALDLVAVPARIVAWGGLVAACSIYLVVALAGLYPSWLATRIEPALALHED